MSLHSGMRAVLAGLEPPVLKVAAVMVVGAFLSIMSITSVNVALQTLAVELHSPLSQIQWVITAYLLALATVIPITGWASEQFGARRLWLATLTSFILASTLCGLAWSAGALIVFRVIQGLAGGMIMPLGMILLSMTAGPERLGRVMSVVGVPMLLGPALGPVLGGLLLDVAGWRWLFFINIPLGLVGLVLAIRLLPHFDREGARRLDWFGLLVVSPGVALLTLGASQVPQYGGVTAPAVYLPSVLGMVLLVVFTVHAARTYDPLIDVRLFTEPRLAAAAATRFLLGAALFGSLVLLPLYFQLVRGEDPLHTGILLAPQGLGAALMMPLSGRLTDRIGGGRVVLGGLVLLGTGTLALTQLTASTSYEFLIAVLVIRGMGLGATMMPAMAAAYAALEPRSVPRATSALNITQRVGGSLGVALLTVILQGQLTDSPAAAASAFGHTFWWAVGLIAAAAVPAVVLAHRESLARREQLGWSTHTSASTAHVSCETR